MRFLCFILPIIWLVFTPVAAAAQDPLAAKAEFFEAKIRPLLVQRCVKCHGSEKVSGELRIDSRQAILQGGDRGPAMIPGDAGESLIIQAVQGTNDDLSMPPAGKLPAHEIALLEQWVNQGAYWPDPSSTTASEITASDTSHWAFAAVSHPVPPSDPTAWSAGPIDTFIAAAHQQHQLEPVGPANRRTLVRRLYLNLLGLPPTPSQVNEFLEDTHPAAWTRLIDRLLASRHYGERWGRHWLDLARYSDTQGGSCDVPIPEARFYRDYVIDAFHVDKPYDQFIQEQIAGDILAAQTPNQGSNQRIIATGFVGLSIRNGIFKLYHPELIIEDAIDTIGRSILGLSIRCARCHDHKFEPISAADYYRMYGIFASSKFPFSGAELPKYSADGLIPLINAQKWSELPQEKKTEIESLRTEIEQALAADPAQQDALKKLEKLNRDIASFNQKLQQGEDDVALRISIDDQDVRHREVLATIDNNVRTLREKLRSAEEMVGISRAYAMREAIPGDQRIQIAGDPFRHGPTVARGIPERFATAGQIKIPAGTSGRLELARWITSPENPLTPRVAVNYLWQFHFGRGIVSTSDNFGLSGSPPTHPALLDWLAQRFMSSGWSVKTIHRSILASSTYRLASSIDPQNTSQAKDPVNHWYWHHNRRRLDAETIRDSMLSISNTLDKTLPGPHPFPNRKSWGFSQHGPFKAVYPSRHRSVYLMTQRVQRHPILALFDGADPSRATTQRRESMVALQALFVRNNPFVHEQADALAQWLLSVTDDPAQRVHIAVQKAWSREATTQDVKSAVAYVERYQQTIEQHYRAQAAAHSNEPPSRDHLLLELSFDGHFDDSAKNGHVGKVIGQPTFAPGHKGQCLSFGGSDYLDTGTTLPELSDTFTVECWVNPATNQIQYNDIFGNHAGGGFGFVMQQDGNQTNRFLISYGAGNNQWVMSRSTALVPGRWQHVAMVKSPTHFRFYINRQLCGEVSSTAKMQPTSTNFRVGNGIAPGTERCFRGMVDELRVWDIAIEGQAPELHPQRIKEMAWASYARLLLASNEFFFVD